MSYTDRMLRKVTGDQRRRTARKYLDGRVDLKTHRCMINEDGVPKMIQRPSPTLLVGGNKWRELLAESVDRRARAPHTPRRGSLWGRRAGRPTRSEVIKRIAIRAEARAGTPA